MDNNERVGKWMEDKRDGRKVEKLATELVKASIDGTHHHKDGTMSYEASVKSAPSDASVDGTIDLTGESGHAVKRRAANTTPSESADSDSTSSHRRDSRRSTASKHKRVKAIEIEEPPTDVQSTDTISETGSQAGFSIPRCRSPESMSTSSGKGPRSY